MIHPYFQILPEVDFFKADVSFNAGALNVTYRIDPAGLAPALVAQLQFQLDRLKLNQRYVAQINKFISEQKVAMLMFSEQGAAIFSDFLLRGQTRWLGRFIGMTGAWRFFGLFPTMRISALIRPATSATGLRRSPIACRKQMGVHLGHRD
jgi:hypothetical protein